MKVIQELVAHFDRKHKLSPRQIKGLLEQGFLAADAPERIMDLCDVPGTTYYFRVTGTTEGIAWGTDVYTGDSMLAVAAVHAGAVKEQATAIVKVTVMTPLANYAGSDRYGVTTHDFGRFGTAFKVERV
jgi:hypothetical protein